MKTQLHGLFLLWLGAAISIAEIVTGTLMAPLGWQRGLAAILVGHLIGCGLFLLPAAYLSAQQHQSAIGVTQTVFGPWGVRLFSLLNALQLLGWTAVMIVNAQLAMNGISQHLLGFHSAALMASIVAALIIVWLLLDHDWLFRVNNLVVILLAVGMLVMMGAILATGHVHPSQGTALSFGSAVELNVTMALSWLPLIGDYTRKTTQPWRASLVSVSGYFLGSVAMFAIGLFTVILTGQADFTAVLAQSKIGILALLVIVFSTVTTTFMDAFSAATNLNNLVHRGHVNLWGVGVGYRVRGLDDLLPELLVRDWRGLLPVIRHFGGQRFWAQTAVSRGLELRVVAHRGHRVFLVTEAGFLRWDHVIAPAGVIVRRLPDEPGHPAVSIDD